MIAVTIINALLPLIDSSIPPGQAFNRGGFLGMMFYCYFACVLPPVILYEPLKERRKLAYIIHPLWFFCAVTSETFLKFSANTSANAGKWVTNGTWVTPHDIYTIRYGLIWSSAAGTYDASDWLLASALVGMVYLYEKFIKETRAKPVLAEIT
jgi:hypothetical protein